MRLDGTPREINVATSRPRAFVERDPVRTGPPATRLLRRPLTPAFERRLLQVAIAAAGFVPVGAGLTGALLGGGMTGDEAHGVDLDSHVRYLSGLLLGIGLAFWEAIPQIEQHMRRVRLLTAIVALGGLMRLIGILTVALPGAPMILGLAMELAVTPLICLWQARVARLYGFSA